MREKYESLSVTVLRDIAKARGLTHLSGLKKSELVELMLREDEKDANAKNMTKIEEKQIQTLEEEKEVKKTQELKDKKKAQKLPIVAEKKEDKKLFVTEEKKHTGTTEDKKFTKTTEKRPSVTEERKFTKTTEKKLPITEEKKLIKTTEKKLPIVEEKKIIETIEKKFPVTEEKKIIETIEKKFPVTEEKKVIETIERKFPVTEEKNFTGTAERKFQIKETERRPTRIITSDGIEIDNPELDSGISANGILEVMPDGYGFIRCENYLPGDHDVYVSPSQIRKFGLKTGDIIHGNTRVKTQQEKFSALLYIRSINGNHPSEILKRSNFEDLTPIFPNERIKLETDKNAVAMRIMDVVSPIGKGQRGMIVSPPKAGKTTLLKQVAKAVTKNNPEMHLIILLIDERPEEVTDIKEAIEGNNVEVIYSTFDELPEHHKRVSEMVIERARRLVEHKKDVMILLDSITRLARAYNLIVPPSGRTLSGGIDPAALHMPKRFFGAARNMREGGSITILATALVDTGSRMDDVIYEEFKGTGNMELILDRKLSERRIFPAVDITKSGTRREDLLLNREEQEAVEVMRRAINGMKADEAVESIMNLFVRTNNNKEFCQIIKKTKLS